MPKPPTSQTPKCKHLSAVERRQQQQQQYRHSHKKTWHDAPSTALTTGSVHATSWFKERVLRPPALQRAAVDVVDIVLDAVFVVSVVVVVVHVVSTVAPAGLLQAVAATVATAVAVGVATVGVATVGAAGDVGVRVGVAVVALTTSVLSVSASWSVAPRKR